MSSIVEPWAGEGVRPCPIPEVLALIGDRWSLLAIREISFGIRRFNEIQEKTGAPRETLTTKLRRLEEAGIIERRRYSERPPRDEYYLTEAGKELRVVITELKRWGDRHYPVAADPTRGAERIRRARS